MLSIVFYEIRKGRMTSPVNSLTFAVLYCMNCNIHIQVHIRVIPYISCYSVLVAVCLLPSILLKIRTQRKNVPLLKQEHMVENDMLYTIL